MGRRVHIVRKAVVTPPVLPEATGSMSVALAGAGLSASNRLNVPVPAVYPLELIQPRASSSTPGTGADMPINPGMPTGHRIFKAYPGIEYNIRAAVLGGSYPFTYALSDAPAGMTINATTGEIRWPNPTGTTVTPRITVTDAENVSVSSTWAITVTQTGFKFVDARAADGGSGTLASPWNTLSDVFTLSAATDIVYFRAGTYNANGLTIGGVGGSWQGVIVPTNRSSKWLAYPGVTPGTVENVYYDAQYDGTQGTLVQLVGTAADPLYVDGIKFHNGGNILLQIASEGGRWQTVRRCDFYDLWRGQDGGNPGGIMALTDNSNTNPCFWSVLQDINGWNLVDAGTLKMYGRFKCLMENVTNVDSTTGSDVAKDNMTRWEVRGCTFRNNSSVASNAGIYGSMNDPGYTGYPFNGEIRFNLVLLDGASDTRWGCHLNEFGRCHQTDVYRNTFVGAKIGVVQLNSYEDGPFRFYNNVIQNSETGDHVTKWTAQYGGAVAAASNVILGTAVGAGRLDNLTGISGLVNPDGTLAPGYANYRGTHGFEV